MQPWRILARIDTPAGPLELRRRGERDFLITVSGRVLMTSVAHRSEDALANLTCDILPKTRRPRVLLGGLGMGYTLRATLDRLPRPASVTVVDVNQVVVDWCRGPLAPLTGGAVDDTRVTIRIGNVAQVIKDAPADHYDAILLDLYEGPHQANNRSDDPLYGTAALRRTLDAIKPGGVFSIWSEEPDRSFHLRLTNMGFAVQQKRAGRGGRTHVIYLATRP